MHWVSYRLLSNSVVSVASLTAVSRYPRVMFVFVPRRSGGKDSRAYGEGEAEGVRRNGAGERRGQQCQGHRTGGRQAKRGHGQGEGHDAQRHNRDRGGLDCVQVRFVC